MTQSFCCHFADANCHYIDIKGTFHESVAEEVMSYARKKFADDEQSLQYTDVWRFKSRLVAGEESDNGL